MTDRGKKAEKNNGKMLIHLSNKYNEVDGDVSIFHSDLFMHFLDFFVLMLPSSGPVANILAADLCGCRYFSVVSLKNSTAPFWTCENVLMLFGPE